MTNWKEHSASLTMKTSNNTKSVLVFEIKNKVTSKNYKHYNTLLTHFNSPWKTSNITILIF